MYQNGYLHGRPSRFSAKSAIYKAAGYQHYIAICTAAVPKPILIYTWLPCVYIKLLFSRQPFKSKIGYGRGYIHGCRWESMYQNGYLHGRPSRFSAKSAIYTAAGYQHNIDICTAAVPEPIQIYTRLPCVHIKSLFTRSHSRAKSAIYIAAGCIHT